MNPHQALQNEVEQAIAQMAETIGTVRFTDLGRTGIRLEYGKPDYDGEYPACVIPHQIPEALRTMGPAERAKVLRWLGLEPDAIGKATLIVNGRTLGQEIKLAIRRIRGGRDGRSNGDGHWLAEQLGVNDTVAGYYIRDLRIPKPQFAAKIAKVLGWSDEHMNQLLRMARFRRVAGEGQ